MSGSRFHGWIYWACFVAYCGWAYVAVRLIVGTIPFLIAVAIPLFPMFIADHIERRNLLSYLERNHRDTWLSLNDCWYSTEWDLHRFIFSGVLNDDSELLLHKRNNRHMRSATIAMLLVFLVSDRLNSVL